MASKALDRITAALEEAADSHGYELVDVELAGAGRRTIVRVFLDREGGIMLDDVAAANEWVSEALDSLGEPAGPYVLEVSSPGIERPLRKPEHFRRFVGDRAEVRLTSPLEGRKQFTGTIAEAGDASFVLDVDGTRVELPYDNLSKARLRVDIDFRDEGSGSKR